MHRIIKVHERADTPSQLDILTKVRCRAGPHLCVPRPCRTRFCACPPAHSPPGRFPAAASERCLPTTLQGDNNWGDDRSLYPKGQLWLNTGHIMGKVVG